MGIDQKKLEEIANLRRDIEKSKTSETIEYSIFEKAILNSRIKYYKLSKKARVLSVILDLIYIILIPVSFLAFISVVYSRILILSIFILIKNILLLPVSLIKLASKNI